MLCPEKINNLKDTYPNYYVKNSIISFLSCKMDPFLFVEEVLMNPFGLFCQGLFFVSEYYDGRRFSRGEMIFGKFISPLYIFMDGVIIIDIQ